MNKLRTLILALVICITNIQFYSQSVVNYTFSQFGGSYSPISGGTVLGTGGFDDNVYNANPIGFTFWFNGNPYTTFSVNANGFLAMGDVVANSYTAISGGTSNQVVSAFNFDLIGNTPTGELRYQTIGSAPNRTLVVQWSNMSAFGGAGTYNFQIRLNEIDYSIDVVYGNYVAEATVRNAQVGLRGSSNAQFNNRQVTNGTHTWSTSVAGTLNTATCQLTTGLIPSVGQTYRWLATAPTAPTTLTFSSIGATSMTLNWIDNSTNEFTFWIYRSTDGINYIPVGTVNSTTTAGTGSPYNFNATGLSANTLYYWQVVAVSEIPSTPLSGTQSTNPGTLCGTYTVGPTGAYTSLTAAFTDLAANSLNCPVIFELQAAYNSSVETFPLNVPFFGGSSLNTVTVRPELGATALSITSNNATATVRMNGTTWITFDGRPGGIGTSRELTISNTNTTGSAILYQNNTQNTGMTYLNITGVNTSLTNGVVNFTNALATGGGNSNNSITFCDLFAGASNPVNMIYSNNATPGTFNQNNIISNNNIRDFFSATNATNGVLISGGNNAWTITNNSFYQTASRTYTTANTHQAINIVNTGSGYIVSNNFIGGTAPLCGGGNYTMGGTVATRFIGINLSATGTNPNIIQSNTIQKFNFSTSSGATTANGIWCAINALGLGTNVNIANNIIGNNTSTGSIITSTSTTGGLTVGIHASASGTLTISDNQIGSITANSSGATISSSVTAINISTTTGTGIRTIQNNFIGSTLIPNSIINASSTSTTAGNMIGIDVSIGGTYNIVNNQITSILNQYIGTSTATVTRGIRITTGTVNISNNTIASIASLAPSTSTGATASVIGIQMSSTTAANHIVQNNIINGLANGNPTAATQVYGLFYSGPTANRGQIRKNNIAYLAAQSSSTATTIVGIFAGGGLATYSNNFVNLGIDPLGASLTLSHVYQGIRKDNTINNNIFHNTVLIQGTGVGTGAANTQAFVRLQSAVDSVYNNIFVNNRSNGSSTGIHYSVQVNNLTTFNSNYNDLFGNGVGYMVARNAGTATDYPSFAAWQGTGQDAVSRNVDPQFVNSINDLHIITGTPNQLESNGALLSILDDIDNQVRPGPAGSIHGGAIKPDIGADEFDGIIVPGTNNDLGVILLVTPTNSTCVTNQTTVTFRITNNAIYTIDFSVFNATLNASVTGPNPFVFAPVVINSGTLAPGANLDVTVSTTYDMSAIGTYNFTGTISIANDLNSSNNSLSTSILGKGAVTASASSDVSICLGNSTTLNATGNASYSNPTTFNSSDTPLNIPDNDIVTGVTSTINVPSLFSVWNASNIVSVNLTITHTWNADLDIYLQAPNGSQIELSTDNGGAGDGYINVTFIPSAPANITTAPTTPNITGSWQPEQPFSLLTGPANGNWNLRVFDDTGTDIGTLENWSITLLGPGGVTYTWTPATGLSDPNIANPLATPTSTTTYIVTVTDNVTGCTATDDVTVTINPLPVITKITTDPTCVPGNDGSIDITVTGTPSFSYSWSTGATTEDLTGVGFGTYTVTVTDGNSCTATNSTTFAVPGFTVSGIVTDVSCFNGNNGEIDITASGGTSPYSYQWSNTATSEDITGLITGSYTVTVTDDIGCTVTGSYTVNQPTAISITTASITDVDCNGNSTGAVNINVSGGTPGYTYQWVVLPSNSPVATTEDISLVAAGTYQVSVTDNNSCTSTASFTVTQPNAINISHTSNNVSCFGFSNGSIDISVNGGVTPYNYLWSNSATTQDISGLAANTYTVTVTDDNNCISTYSVVITQPTVLTHTITSSNVLCFGDNSGTAQVFPTGGTTPYTFAWSNGATTDFVNLPQGTFTVTITDFNGCTNTNSVTITQPLLLTANIIDWDDVTCNNANNGSASAIGGFGTPGYSYTWSNGATTATVNGLDGGVYTVTVQDANGCTATASVTINEPSAITSSASITNEIWGNDGAINITPAGGTAPYSFNWSNSATTEDIAGLAGGTYTVTITDDNGCTQTFTYTVVSQLGIDGETTGLGTINFYPNPSNGQLNMSMNGFTGGTLQLEVLDMNGKVVFVKQIKNAPESFIQEMDLRTLTMGTYFIRVISNNGMHTSRIIIARD
ncbi:MAG: proprotein convertase P-domain-containing protein [Flavobacteriales bacterium]|nr:proprotein convertase P-domain-containing protein [Flavobacteriales bacterium]